MTQTLINTLIIFTVCSLINVILNTIKTLIMYRKETLSSATINAVTYGFYTIIVVLMAGDIPLVWKIILTAFANFVGVIISMKIMEHFERERLWKIESAIKFEKAQTVADLLDNAHISYNYSVTSDSKYVMFNIYSKTKEHSRAVREILKEFNAKYFVTEGKTL